MLAELFDTRLDERTIGRGLTRAQEAKITSALRIAGLDAIKAQVTGQDYKAGIVPGIILTTVSGQKVNTLFVVSAYRQRGFTLDAAMNVIRLSVQGHVRLPSSIAKLRADKIKLFDVYPETQAIVVIDATFPEDYDAAKWRKVVQAEKRNFTHTINHEAIHVQRMYDEKHAPPPDMPSYVAAKKAGHTAYLTHPIELEADIGVMVQAYKRLKPAQRQGLTLQKLMKLAGVPTDRRIAFKQPDVYPKVITRLYQHGVTTIRKLKEEFVDEAELDQIQAALEKAGFQRVTREGTGLSGRATHPNVDRMGAEFYSVKLTPTTVGTPTYKKKVVDVGDYRVTYTKKGLWWFVSVKPRRGPAGAEVQTGGKDADWYSVWMQNGIHVKRLSPEEVGGYGEGHKFKGIAAAKKEALNYLSQYGKSMYLPKEIRQRIRDLRADDFDGYETRTFESLDEEVKLVRQMLKRGLAVVRIGTYGWFEVYYARHCTFGDEMDLKKRLKPGEDVQGWLDRVHDARDQDVPEEWLSGEISSAPRKAKEATSKLQRLGFPRQRTIVVIQDKVEMANPITGDPTVGGYAHPEYHAIVLAAKMDDDAWVHEWAHMYWFRLPKKSKDYFQRWYDQNVVAPTAQRIGMGIPLREKSEIAEQVGLVTARLRLKERWGYDLDAYFRARREAAGKSPQQMVHDYVMDKFVTQPVRLFGTLKKGLVPEKDEMREKLPRLRKGSRVYLIHWAVPGEQKALVYLRSTAEGEFIAKIPMDEIDSYFKLDFELTAKQNPEQKFEEMRTSTDYLTEPMTNFKRVLEHAILEAFDAVRPKLRMYDTTPSDIWPSEVLDKIIDTYIRMWNAHERGGTKWGPESALIHLLRMEGKWEIKPPDPKTIAATISRPEGDALRKLAAARGLPSSYAASNPKELWAVTVEYASSGHVSKELKQAVRNVLQGVTESLGGMFVNEGTCDYAGKLSLSSGPGESLADTFALRPFTRTHMDAIAARHLEGARRRTQESTSLDPAPGIKVHRVAMPGVKNAPLAATQGIKVHRTGLWAKEAVNYRPGDDTQRCGNCVFVRLPSKCRKVEGQIDQDYVCDLWKKGIAR